MANLNSEIFGFNEKDINDENFLVEVETAINRIMSKKKIKKSELAQALGVSRPRVSQLLSSDGQNMTLKTLASIFTALEESVEITSETLRELNSVVQERVRRREELRIQSQAQATWLQQVQKDDFAHAEVFTSPNKGSFSIKTDIGYNYTQTQTQTQTQKIRRFA